MHRLIFGYSFTELVAPILLLGITLYFLNKKKASVRGNVDDADTGTYDSMIVPTDTNSVGSSSSPTETNNNESSSLTVSTGNHYEVFLSFRGPDTRHGFTDHLYDGLLKAGIHTFRDDDELCQGEDIRPELMTAIRNSKVLIPIFSVDYGTSSWCLDELVQIMERKNNNGQMVLPIFYKVKPADVGHQIGSFGKAFDEHVKRLLQRSSFDPVILEKWKQALLEVCNLKGYDADGSRSEAELVKSVVQKVLSELKKKFELIISENLVGIDSHVKNVMELLDDKSHARLFVGIHGMGGIGKTTLAKTIYNELSNQFEHRSFIADIRESWKRGAHDLQNKLISDISNQKNEVSNKDEGINFIRSRFKDKKVLLLLDDVDNVDQVRCLVGNHDWFSLGSMIIITARNKRILELAGVDHTYDLTELDPNQSLILFSKHAFRKDCPPSEFEGLTREVVSTSGGLPLFLEVLGSSLSGKESKDWREMIKKLRKVPCKEVQDKLKISYDALEYEQQQIFLDIACFLIGTDETIAFYMWDTCDFFPGENIEVLRFMSLIKIGDDHGLRMHDQLRDLGRAIVREENQQQPGNRSRLWDSEEALEVLKRNKGTDKIEAIDLSKGNSKGVGKTTKQDGDIYIAKQFKNLTNLRFLYMKGAHLRGDFKDSMELLRWLRWPNCPVNFEVNNFHIEKLAILELSRSKINEKWEGWSFFIVANKLKYLDLSYCDFLENTDFLSAFKKLEVLILIHCSRLKRIDASIGDMEALLRLDICHCGRLTELPAEIGKLKALQQLLLRGTRSLFALPDSIGCLENLEILDISYSGIEELPNGIGRLRKLQELKAYSCNNLKRIMAESMCNLSSLQLLNFLDCHNLQLLPDLPSSLTDLVITCQSHKLPSLSHLAHLKVLYICDCKFLKCIQVLPSTQLKSSECSQPTDVEESKSPQSFKFEILDVQQCGSIETPDVSQFIHLRTLFTKCCENLLEIQGLDKLIYLESLTIKSCNSIERLELPKFEGLKKLHASRCNKLAEIQGLDSLERLDIKWCTSIKRLDLPKSGMLKELKAEGCKNLAEIQGLDGLEYLERLDIAGCTSMERLYPPKSRRLKELRVDKCENLAEIQGIDRLEYLEKLSIERCTSMERLYLPKSERLKHLVVYECKNLVEIQGLDESEYLESLCIAQCTSMERLYLPKSRRLKELVANRCTNLAEIQGIDRSEYLEMLDIEWCTSMERLYVPKSGRLKLLHAKGCENLAEIQGIDRSEYLEILDIEWCTSMERLYLPKVGRLKKLCVGYCTNLSEIQSLDRSESLKILNIDGWTPIERLDLLKFKRLNQLNATYCKNLAEIQGLDRSEYLYWLDISGCTSIKRLDLPKFGRLNVLNARSCKNLAKIQGLDRSEYLERLDISRCISMERLDLPKSRGLEKLKVGGCRNLAEIKGLDRLEYLESLDIGGCTSIERLDLPKFGRLKELNAGGCKNLVEIQGLDSLEYLKSLDISRCTSIGRLDLQKSRSMEILYANSCKKLAEIQGLDRFESLERLDISRCTSIEKLLLPKSKSLKILEARDCENLVEIQGLDWLDSLKELNIIGCKSLKTIPELSRTQIYRYYEITDGGLRSSYMDDSDEEYIERIHIG